MPAIGGDLLSIAMTRLTGNSKHILRSCAASAPASMEAKARILEAAEALFLRNGIKGVSMDDIAVTLAMSKKTLYKTFANKDEIVQASMAAHLRKVQADCARVGEQAANVVQKMVRLARWADEQFKEVHPSIIHDLRKYHPLTWALFREHQHTFLLEQLVGNLHRGIAEGVFRPELDVEVLARLQLGLTELVFDTDLYPPGQFAAPRIHRILDEHFLLGIATRRGQQLFSEYQHQSAT